MPETDYRFDPVQRADFPLLRHWLAAPHMQGHWGDPETEMNLISGDFDNEVIDMWIVSLDAPFAYVQDYPAHHWPMPHYADFPKGTRAIDTFVGAPAYLNKGHAARYMRQHAEALLAKGYPAVVIDPSPDNSYAVKAYKNAGFTGNKVLPCEDGDPVLVLAYKGTEI